MLQKSQAIRKNLKVEEDAKARLTLQKHQKGEIPSQDKKGNIELP
jgi:hypothetical protein